MSVARPLFSELTQVRSTLDQADQVLVVMDYDGTLAPIVNDPNDAAVPRETNLLLAAVAAAGHWTLAIVSGRSLSDLKSKTQANAILAGNHGLEIEGPGISFLHERAQLAAPLVAEMCCELETRFRCVPGVIVEYKRLTATVHFRQAPPELGSWVKATVEAVVRPARRLLYLAPALQAIEIRPRIAWNKGSAVRFLLGLMRATSPALICAGDDRTDEDMFRILPGEISVKVGAATGTQAQYFVRTPQELCRFLQWLSRIPDHASDVTDLHASSCLAALITAAAEKGFAMNRKLESALRNESSSK